MKVPYKVEDFKKIREEGYIYIDKTKYIETIENQKVLMYTRPKGFGKSMLTSMLYYYYSVSEKENFEKLFKGTYIYENPTKNRNNYYVLQFDFSGMVTEEISQIEELRKLFNERVIEQLDKFIGRYELGIEYDKTENAALMLLDVLSKFSWKRRENQVYIIIDEYDNFTNGILQKNTEKSREILKNTEFVIAFYEIIKEEMEKLNPPVADFFATGLVPLILDIYTGGFNIVTNITTDERYVAMCGLTEEEVKKTIEMAGIKGKLAEETYKIMEQNYGGYVWSKYNTEHIFNTALVMYYLNKLQETGNPPVELLDKNLIEENGMVENTLDIIEADRKDETINKLLLTGEVEVWLTERFELGRSFDTYKFLSMLYYLGYITLKEERGMLEIYKIPNEIVKSLYTDFYKK